MNTPETQPGGSLKPVGSAARYERASDHDKRFKRGDDYAADGWLDLETGKIVEVVVGHNPNGYPPLEPNDRCQARREQPRT